MKNENIQLALSREQVDSVITLYSSGKINEAIDAIKVLTKDFPNEPLLYNISGVCYKTIGQLDVAVKSFEKALAIKPDYTEVNYNLGLTFQELGQLDAAVKCYEDVLAVNPEHAEAHNNLGVTLKELEQLDAAVKSYEKAIAIKPDYAEAHNNLGNALKELGQLDVAVKSYEKAIAIKPDFAETHNNLGNALQGLGQLDEAVKSYEQAIAIQSDFSNAYYNLGNVLRELGQLDDAVKSYEKAIAIKPDYDEAHNNLGNALQGLGQLDEAVKSYEQAIAIQSDFSNAYYNLGNVLRELGQVDTAVRSYKKAIVIKPDYAKAHNNLGIALQDLGQMDTAVKNLEKAIAITPDFAEAHHNLGIALQDLGQIDAAVKGYEKAIAIKPDYAEAYHNLSYLKKYTANDPQISIMQSLLSRSDLNLSNRIHLCLALAEVNENLGNQDEFFEFLHEGNRLRKKELNYSIDKDQNLFSIIKKIFSSPPSLSYEPSTIRPVFIVGMPRSGTTLVEQIIASHHAVYGAGELTTLPTLIDPIARDHLAKDENNLSEKVFLSIRHQYLDALSRFNAPEKVITDKLPLNFQYIGFILSAFPEAKIVHLRRDPMATCWSNYKCFFINKENGYSYNLEDLAGFYGLYTDLMDFWHNLFPDKIYDMCYEDLTTNQEEETRKLLEYCELDWDENCLNFHTSKRAVKTASALQVRQKMYQGSSEVWKKHEVYLQPLIKALSSY
uniref:TPR domain/sulfotransferase domain protein n=1 Tax=uncultured marine bacterium 560 TaxID=257395 RepID=Q6SGF9_9BACT|nr:TPR domain/sulfotransferase domain protein [uncultured marine bacterium 560]